MLFFGFSELANRALLGVTNMEDVNTFLILVHREDDPMRFENQLPQVLIEVLPLTRKRTTFRELFQSVDLAVECLEPPRRVQRGSFVNVCKGFSNPGLRLGSDNDLILHFGAIPCSFARAS